MTDIECGSLAVPILILSALQVRKVSANEHPVLLGMANIPLRSECIRNKGC